jgi:hypothetical protein
MYYKVFTKICVAIICSKMKRGKIIEIALFFIDFGIEQDFALRAKRAELINVF